MTSDLTARRITKRTKFLAHVGRELHFTVEHATANRRHVSKRFPWCLYREAGNGGLETFPDAESAIRWADKLNRRLAWTRTDVPEEK